mgnify:CR=1 FL=1
MNIAERLDTIRQTTPGCELIAFGDLGTRLVLRSSAVSQPPQEYLDQLCAQADHGFGLQDALASQVSPHPDITPEVMVITAQAGRIYIRSQNADQNTASDAILCVCDCEITAKSLIDPAINLLNDLAGGA